MRAAWMSLVLAHCVLPSHVLGASLIAGALWSKDCAPVVRKDALKTCVYSEATTDTSGNQLAQHCPIAGQGSGDTMCTMCDNVIAEARRLYKDLELHLRNKDYGLDAVSQKLGALAMRVVPKIASPEFTEKFADIVGEWIDGSLESDEDITVPEHNFFIGMLHTDWEKLCSYYVGTHEECAMYSKKIVDAVVTMIEEDEAGLSDSELKTIHWAYQRVLRFRSAWSIRALTDINGDPFQEALLFNPCLSLYGTNKGDYAKCIEIMDAIAEYSDHGGEKKAHGKPLFRQFTYARDVAVCSTRTLGCCPGIDPGECIFLRQISLPFYDLVQKIPEDVYALVPGMKDNCVSVLKACEAIKEPMPQELKGFFENCPSEISLATVNEIRRRFARHY